jgi:hypothetical protein
MSMTEKPKERDEKGKLVPGHMIRLEHGAFSFLKNGKVPSIRGGRRIRRELSELRCRLEQVVPGSDDVRKAVLIGQVVKSQGFILLIESFLRRFGVLDLPALSQGKLEAAGALSYVISFMNTQARAVSSLGMDSKELEAIKAPYEIVQEEEKSK